jgi:hypothetical protein
MLRTWKTSVKRTQNVRNTERKETEINLPLSGG